MKDQIDKYLLFLESNFYASKSIQKARSILYYFESWLTKIHISEVMHITEDVLLAYQKHLKDEKKTFGKSPSLEYQIRQMKAIHAFFDYLMNKNILLANPAEKINLPRLRNTIPKNILSKEEAELVLSQPDVSTTLGLRDRTMMELFYATGMRRMEVAHLKLHQIDFVEKTIEIRESKGAKDRIIPVSDRVLGWLKRYLKESRLEEEEAYFSCTSLRKNSSDFVFLNCHKRPWNITNLTRTIKKYFIACGLGHLGACHVFRHTLATRMLESGVDFRLIQEMLGHKDINVTQIYAKVSVHKLQEVHKRTHPAKLKGMSKRYWLEKNGSLSEKE